MLPESSLGSGEELVVRDTDFSLGPICSQVDSYSRYLGPGRGWGGNPSWPANTWAESLAPSPQENGC